MSAIVNERLKLWSQNDNLLQSIHMEAKFI